MSNIFIIGALKFASKPGSPPPASPPNPPGSVTASIAGLAVSGSFVDQAGDEVDFLVEKTVNNGASWTTHQVVLALTGTGLQGTFSDTLLADQAARYRVTARNASGNSVAVVSPQVISTPNAPTSLAQNGAIQPGQVPLTCQDNSVVESAFELERSPNGTTGWAKVGNDIPARTGTGSLNMVDSTVTPSSGPYYYRVRSKVVGGGGASAYSNVAGPFNTPAATGAAPVAQFVKFKDINYAVELDTSASYDPDGPALTSRTVDWGDGVVESHPTQIIFFHTYSGPGPWLIKLTVQKADGQTHIRQSQVWPKLDRSHDFTDNFSTGALAPQQNNIFYRSSPSNSRVVSGKAAYAPSTFSVEKEYPAKVHGGDNQTATEQRMGCNEELNEIHLEWMVWFPDGTEGWANEMPLAATQPTLPKYYLREQNAKNISNCSSVAGSPVITTTTTGQLRNADHGPTGLPSPGQQFVVGNAFRLAGTFDSDGAGNLVGTGTSWNSGAHPLAPGVTVIIGGNNYSVQTVTDDTHCKVGSIPQPFMGTNKVPPVGVGQTMAFSAHILNVNEGVSPVQVTMDRNAINTVGPVTGVVGGTTGENNKFFIIWDNNNNYSGDVTVSIEHQCKPGVVAPGDAVAVHKSQGKGAKQATPSVNPGNYPPNGTFPLVTDDTRGRWARVRISTRFARNMTAQGQFMAWLDDELVLDVLSPAGRPYCAHPRGNNFYKSWYIAGWANSGFSQDTSWFLGQHTYWSVAPDWFPGWSV